VPLSRVLGTRNRPTVAKRRKIVSEFLLKLREIKLCVKSINADIYCAVRVAGEGIASNRPEVNYSSLEQGNRETDREMREME
jgi:hypothetical protein